MLSSYLSTKAITMHRPRKHGVKGQGQDKGERWYTSVPPKQACKKCKVYGKR